MTPLTVDEERELLARAQAGDREAMEQLINRNEGLVVEIAKRFYFPCGDRDLDDLINAGREGVKRAVELWEEGKAGKFSTYATPWIRTKVRRALSGGTPFYLPCHQIERIARMKRVRAWLVQELHREPTAAEIAKRAGLDISYVENWLQVLSSVVELDKPVVGDEDEEGDLYKLTDSGEETPEQALIRRADLEELQEALKILDAGQRFVITKRYFSSPQVTFEMIGKMLHVSKQRAEQIEAQALRRLRNRMRFVPC